MQGHWQAVLRLSRNNRRVSNVDELVNGRDRAPPEVKNIPSPPGWGGEGGFPEELPFLTCFDLDVIVNYSIFIRLRKGKAEMGDKGSKDKGKREQLKKAQLTAKEKRKLKKEKKNK